MTSENVLDETMFLALPHDEAQQLLALLERTGECPALYFRLIDELEG